MVWIKPVIHGRHFGGYTDLVMFFAAFYVNFDTHFGYPKYVPLASLSHQGPPPSEGWARGRRHGVATKCAAAGLSPGLERRARSLITSCQRHAKKNNAQLNAQLYFS